MESIFPSKFQEQLYKRAKILKYSPPKFSWQERIDQFHRIKAQSTRTNDERRIAEPEGLPSAE